MNMKRKPQEVIAAEKIVAAFKEDQEPERYGKMKQPLGSLSIIFACLSLLILPPLFGLVGLILGIIGTAKGEGGAAITGLVLSIILPIIGMMLALAFGLAMLGL